LQAPLALRYHGHQFRQYDPDLGDGRGFLFAQMEDREGRLLDLGTKGSGQTPWSRAGDGRLTLKGAVREILATEMLQALGVPTSRTLAVVETGEALQRSDEPSPARSAVLTRLSHSHIRFGSFQRLAYLDQKSQMQQLLTHIGKYYLPELTPLDPEQQAVAFLAANVGTSAKLTAKWMASGFVHGVLNTDNMSINGESFDYGPWRFLPWLDPDFTAAYFDQQGLYAYGRQPEAVSWNLARLGEALSSLAPTESLQAEHAKFSGYWQQELPQAFLDRLGLQAETADKDLTFVQTLIQTLRALQIPFEGFFFDWFCADEDRAMTRPNLAFYQRPEFSNLRDLLLARTPVQPERLQHVYFSAETPPTLLIEDVEALWAPIAKDDDWSLFENKLTGIHQAGAAFDFAHVDS
jgi:uncharacterized protein YdiU (UPF0061 family)